MLEVTVLLFPVFNYVVSVAFDEVYAVKLSLVVYHVIAFQLTGLAFFAHYLKRIDKCPQLIVVHILIVPFGHLMELK